MSFIVNLIEILHLRLLKTKMQFKIFYLTRSKLSGKKFNLFMMNSFKTPQSFTKVAKWITILLIYGA